MSADAIQQKTLLNLDRFRLFHGFSSDSVSKQREKAAILDHGIDCFIEKLSAPVQASDGGSSNNINSSSIVNLLRSVKQFLHSFVNSIGRNFRRTGLGISERKINNTVLVPKLGDFITKAICKWEAPLSEHEIKIEVNSPRINDEGKFYTDHDLVEEMVDNTISSLLKSIQGSCGTMYQNLRYNEEDYSNPPKPCLIKINVDVDESKSPRVLKLEFILPQKMDETQVQSKFAGEILATKPDEQKNLEHYIKTRMSVDGLAKRIGGRVGYQIEDNGVKFTIDIKEAPDQKTELAIEDAKRKETTTKLIEKHLDQQTKENPKSLYELAFTIFNSGIDGKKDSNCYESVLGILDFAHDGLAKFKQTRDGELGKSYLDLKRSIIVLEVQALLALGRFGEAHNTVQNEYSGLEGKVATDLKGDNVLESLKNIIWDLCTQVRDGRK